MLLRPVRPALAAAVAIGICLLFVAPGQATAADPVGSPSLTLIGQSQYVSPPAPGEPATFALDVGVGTVAAGTELVLTVYQKLGTRSAFQQTLTSAPTGVLENLPPTPISALKPVGSGFEDDLSVVPSTPQSASSTTINLSQAGPRCVAGNGSCSGVYPVLIQLVEPAGSVVSHFTTYLTYAETKSQIPLVFSWVVPVAAPVRIRSGGSLSDALPPLDRSRVSDLANLTQSLLQSPTVQASVAASPATIEKLEESGSRGAREVVANVTKLAASGATHRLIAEPYVPINLGELTAAGVTEDIAGQTGAADAIMDPLLHGLPATDQPSATTWVATGSVNAATLGGLATEHATSLVLPDTDLPQATEESHATWSQPFTLSGGRDQDVTAAVSDSQLSSYFTAEPHDPALAATQLLADLAVINFELPDAPDTRGVIAVPPSDWDPNPTFVDTLINGLVNNPVIATATLPEFFASVPIGGNEADTTRQLSSNESGPQIDASEAAAIVTAREQVTGFDNAVTGHTVVETELDELLLASESSDLRPSAQKAGLAAFDHHLAAELANVQVVQNTVTLTARTASIPITIVSSADFQLKATLALDSPKLEFPDGATRTVLIDHPTNSTRIEVRARTSGDLPLTYKLTSPGGGLVIAHGTLTVRSTATSVVGIVLTLVAAVVLLGWWARTWRRGRRQRLSARSARGGAT